jgi:hypothetical protein
MKNTVFVIIFLIVVVLSTIGVVFLYTDFQKREVIEQRNLYCQSISDSVNSNLTLENIQVCDCYYAECYYPNEQVTGATEFTCVCDCLLKNNSTTTICVAKFTSQNE